MLLLFLQLQNIIKVVLLLTDVHIPLVWSSSKNGIKLCVYFYISITSHRTGQVRDNNVHWTKFMKKKSWNNVITLYTNVNCFKQTLLRMFNIRYGGTSTNTPGILYIISFNFHSKHILQIKQYYHHFKKYI